MELKTTLEDHLENFPSHCKGKIFLFLEGFSGEEALLASCLWLWHWMICYNCDVGFASDTHPLVRKQRYTRSCKWLLNVIYYKITIQSKSIFADWLWIITGQLESQAMQRIWKTAVEMRVSEHITSHCADWPRNHVSPS